MKTMFRSLLSLALSAACAVSAFGQYTISGKLTSEDGEPAVAVVSLHASDSLVGATIADAQGAFEFREVKAGDYVLTVSDAASQPVTDSIALRADLSRRYVLYPVRQIDLDEVTVTADRSATVRQTASGAVFRLPASAKKATSAFAALNGIPSLVVDESNRTVRMNSGSAPLVLINGIQTANGLNGVDPEDIESVEVIEVPSARYVSDGVRAVLNVRTVRKTQRYRWLNAYTRHSVPKNYGISGVSAETGGARWMVYLTGQHFYFSDDESRYLLAQQNGGYSKSSEATGFYNSNSYYASVGGDRVFSDRDYLSYGVTYISNPTGTTQEGSGLLVSGDVRSPFDISTNSENSYYVNTYNAYYRHDFRNRSQLEATFRLNLNGNRMTGETRETYADRPQYHYLFDYDNFRTSSSLDLNYAFDLSGQSLNAGSRTKYRKDRINHISLPVFNYRELDESLYADATGPLGDRFSYMVSAGVDMILNRSGEADNSYYSPAASASLTYRASPYSSMRLSGLLSSESPDIRYMNPYNTSSDSLHVTAGNPYLRPARQQSVTLGYTFNRSGLYLAPQVTYRTVSGYIVPRGSNDGTVYTQTYANDARFSELDGMLTLRYSGRRGSIGGSAGYLRSYFVNVDRGSFYMNANFNASYRNVSVNGTAWYQRYSFTPLSTMRHYAPESEVTFNWRLSAAVTLQAGMRYFLGGLKTELHQEDRGYRTDSTQEMLDRKYLVLAGLNINLRNRAPKSRMEKRLYQDESGIQLK